MTIVQISPVFNVPTITDESGNPATGYIIKSYEAGSFSVFKPTYTDSTGTTANPLGPGPVGITVLSDGTIPNAIWLTRGESYNLVLYRPDGTTPVKNFDAVTGVGFIPGTVIDTTTVWVDVPNPAFLTSTSFVVTGNFTQEFRTGNRVRLVQSPATVYGTITGSTFSSPNTTVNVVLDSGTLNPSLSESAYSILVAAPGSTVDAGGVSYHDSLSYSTTNTVGNKIKQIDQINVDQDNIIDRDNLVWVTSGGPAYTLSPVPAISALSEKTSWTVRWNSAYSGTAATLNINSTGAVPIRQYDSTGAPVAISVAVDQISNIAYDGTQWIILDPLPAPPASAPPVGAQTFTANGNFTVPAGVFAIQVTCVAGGGGGGAGNDTFLGFGVGGDGGIGGHATRRLAVNPGDVYTVTVGAAGAAGTVIPLAAATAGGNTVFGASTVVATGGGAGGAGAIGSNGSPGANGTCSVGTYGTSGVPYSIPGGGVRGQRGVGGVGSLGAGTAGTAGFCAVEW